MVICPQCNIPHDPEEEFCKKCGKFLLVVEDEPSIENEGIETKPICPKCKKIYKKGNYCRKCGSTLGKGSSEIDLPPLEIKSIKKWARQCQRLIREKKEIEICLANLEAHQERFSREILTPISNRYKNRLEVLSPLPQHIENEVKSLRKRIINEIDFLQNGLFTLQKGLGELNSLHQSGIITKSDFLRESGKIKKEKSSKKRRIKQHQQTLSLLPYQRGGEFLFPNPTWSAHRPLISLMVCIVFALIVGGVYLLLPKHSQPSKPISKEVVLSSSLPHSPDNLSASEKEQEIEKIKSVFENIRFANLQKDIHLFISCFSSDFKDLEGKRLDTLKMWENFSYLHLSYNIKKQEISGTIARVRVEWSIRTLKKGAKQPQDDTTLMEVTMGKEDGHWKVKEIKPAS